MYTTTTLSIVSRSGCFLPFLALLEAGKHSFLCQQSFLLSTCTVASFERGTLEQIVDFARALPQDRFQTVFFPSSCHKASQLSSSLKIYSSENLRKANQKRNCYPRKKYCRVLSDVIHSKNTSFLPFGLNRRSLLLLSLRKNSPCLKRKKQQPCTAKKHT